MAGESPDKSEQQKSSGETTSGDRDPRLAVFRQEAAAPRAEGPIDQPTAVFKTLPSPAAARDAAGSASGSGSGSGSAGDGAVASSAAAGSADVLDAGDENEDPDAPAEPDASSDGDDARLRAAVAAWVSRSDKSREPEPAPDTDVATEAGASVDDEADVDVEDGDDSDGDADQDAETAAAAEDAATSEPTVASDASEPAEGDDDDPTTNVEDGGAHAPAPASSEAHEPESSDAEDADGADADADADAEDADGADADAEDADGADADAEDDEQDGRPVDQPTAVFKALPRPAVDQPTTALKITPPPAPEPGAKPEPKPTPELKPQTEAEPETGPKPETEAERTSKFVPLRRDEVHPAPAPAPAASPAFAPAAPASLPEVERTKQQPLPPKPPLDLLAELTNTPPPPQTPVRTAMRRIRIWTPLVVLLLIVFAIVQLVRPLPEPVLTLTATSEYTFDGGAPELPWPAEGQSAVEVEGVGSLGTRGAQEPAPIASVAKTMTAYVILENHPLKGQETGPQIEVDQKAEEESKAEDESTAPIRAGQKFSEKQMLQLLMIPSGNNAARLLARWDSPSEAAFVEKMNAAAKELGMNDTTYTDPSGLKATTVSTASDQLKLAKAVMQNDVFREIVNTPETVIDGIDGKIYNNNNILLNPGVSGIKTGSSTPAGGNLLWAADTVVDGKSRRIYGAVFGIQRGDSPNAKLESSLQDSLKLIQGAQAAVSSATVVKKGTVVGYVDDGLGGRVPVVATKDVKALGWPGLKVELEIGAGRAAIPHAAKAGMVVGEVSVGTGTGKASSPLVLQSDLEEPGVGAKLTRVA
ncbi:serine hydrolase [Streptomyces sp. NPDC002133]|uniref:serine hydrolase n=1 Tax=Streptomyces sp. NPDC002133 TaxID=3154409 RepID=UPI00332A934F